MKKPSGKSKEILARRLARKLTHHDINCVLGRGTSYYRTIDPQTGVTNDALGADCVDGPDILM